MTALTVDVDELNSFLMDFAVTVTQTNFSVFPLDLKTVNNVITKILMCVDLHRNSSVSTLYCYPCRVIEQNSFLLDNMSITEVINMLHIATI